ETYRRAIYHQNARAARIDLFSEFDCPDSAFAAPARASTTTPLQALTLLNHRFTLDMAGFLAGRIEREAGSDARAQIGRAFRLLGNRAPAAEEEAASLTLLQHYGLPALCRALLNSNELVYLQ
ncbi:MAG TPA: DUF1553 domain-containing protein, partial [Pirellulales bacterium]|nr:DUF1553 domain-containing protein [Pirellulales bacterium]